MALNEEDLKFKLTVDPDTAKTQAALKDLGKELDRQQDAIREINLAMDPSILRQRVELEKQLADAKERYKSAYESEKGRQSPPEVIDLRELERVRINKDLEGSYQRQVDLLKKINAAMDSDEIRRRVALDKQLSEAQARYKQTYAEEQKRQNPDESKGLRRLLSNLASGSSLNLRQLAGSAIGGAISGGPGGAIGAAAGGVGAEAISGAFGTAGVVAGAAAGGVLLLVDALKGLSNAVAGFVQVASPGIFAQWQYAWRDLQGVIGQTLGPVLVRMTAIVRGFADALAAVLPSSEQMENALRDLDPLIRILTGALRGLAETISLNFGRSNETNFYRDEEGKLHRGAEPSSFGAAARPAHYTSAEGFEKSFQEAALSASSTQGNVQQRQLTTQQQSLKTLQSIDAKLGGGKGGRTFEGVNNSIKDFVESFSGAKEGNRRAIHGY